MIYLGQVLFLGSQDCINKIYFEVEYTTKDIITVCLIDELVDALLKRSRLNGRCVFT